MYGHYINNSMKSFKNYLREAKVRVYHGSRNNHGRFTIPHRGENSHTFGNYDSKRYGVFFTKNKKFAMIYGDVDEYELHLRKVADLDSKKDNIIDNFLGYLKKNNYELYRKRESIRQTWEYFENDIGKEFFKYLRSKGYDGARFVEFLVDDKGKEQKSITYVLLDLSRVLRNPDKRQPDLFLR